MPPEHSAHPDPRREFALNVVRQLREAGFHALWAGGCVRDQLLGKEPKDYDVATNALPDDVIRTFGERRTVPVGAAFGVVMIPGPTKRHGQVEVATFRSDGQYLDGRRPESVRFCSPEEDAQRRDFTINGMFFDPISQTVLDFVGGQSDLQQHLIRAIGDPKARFNEDRLRMLRAVRFAATFAFALDPQTLLAIQQQCSQIHSVSVERILQELRRMLAHPSRATALQLLKDSQLLPEILPELAPGLDDPTALQLTLRTLQNLESVHFEPALAILLLPLHQSPSQSRHRLTPTQQLCRRLKMSNDEIDTVTWLLDSLPLLHQLATKPLHIRKTLLAHPHTPLLLAVAAALDIAAARTPDDSSFAWHFLANTPPAQLNPPHLINGSDLLAAGLKPGPQIRQILETVRIAQLDEQLQSRHAALELAHQLIANPHPANTTPAHGSSNSTGTSNTPFNDAESSNR
jgi:tRNA nucleotidyltransferase/poly(A) polymerase